MIDSQGIYETGHGGYKETISVWRRQREGIVKRLRNFENNLSKIRGAVDIIEQAKKDNPLKNNLPF
jgi:hypothetical protein